MSPTREHPFGWRAVAREAAPLLLFAAAGLGLTWPLAVSPDQAISLRGDYYLNLWNFWWVKTVLSVEGQSLLFTDYLHYPTGVSLARHVLSPVNALPGGLLSGFLSLHAAFEILLFVHFWLSAWVFFLFARALTGSSGGSLLAGLVYSFCPFHFFYLAQINVATMEFLPLAGLFLVKVYREGRVRNALGLALAAVLLVASSSYYALYAGVLGALLLLGGGFWDDSTPFALGARRLLLAGLGAAIAVALVAWPLISAGLEASRTELDTVRGEQLLRSNDLLGFNWIGGPERVLVSWPSMLGYSTAILVALGLRWDRRQLFWLAVAGVFLLLSLGPTLLIGGERTGVPLLYGLFADLPIVWMLRKPDRFFVMVQLAVAVLVAFSWKNLAAPIGASARRWVLVATAAVLVFELSAMPLDTFAITSPRYFSELSRNDGVHSLVDLPHYGGNPGAARSNYFQTLHEKKIPQGYLAGLALTERNRLAAIAWRRAQSGLLQGDPGPLLKRIEALGLDLVVLHKTAPRPRAPLPLNGRTVWAPFVWSRRELVGLRQRGHFVEAAVPEHLLERQKVTLRGALGEPAFEDESIVVFRPR